MDRILYKFTLEEIYLIRACSLKTPDRDSIIKELEGYLDLEGMEDIVRGILKKMEKVTEGELKKLWEFSLD
jgi:hypothetical protein